MHALVDGHNAIFRLGLTGASPEGVRGELLRRVAARTRHATVFFDALGAPALAPGVDRQGGLEVRYARGQEADALILEAVRGSAHPSELLVVSDDRELCGRARQLGARGSTVAEFLGETPAAAAAAAAEAPPSGPRRHEKPLTAADFGLPEVIDLSTEAQAPSPAAPPAPPIDPVAKARAWAERVAASAPTRHVLLCAEATQPKCATAEVGRAAWERLKSVVKELGLDAVRPPEGGRRGACVLRTKVDCLRVCADGPIAVVYPDGVWYRGATAEVVERIVREHVVGGRPVASHVLARLALPPSPGPGAPGGRV